MSRSISITRARCLAAAALLTMAGSATAGISQDESTVTVVEGAEPQALVYGDHTSGAAISPTVDLDYYNFNGDAGDLFRITIDGTSNYFDPKVEVFGPGGYSNSTYCSAGYGTCSIVLEDVLPESGGYAIIVSDAGSDEAGTYTLQLERIPPARRIFVLPYGFTAQELISPTTDHDFFRFHGEGGSRVRIVMDGTSNYFDPLVEVYGPDGTLVASQYCSAGYGTCSFNLEFDIVESGTHSLVVSDAGHDESGYYNVSVNCLYGCPPFTTTVPRNGTGVNPVVFSTAWPPAIGGTWVGKVDATSQPGAATAVYVYPGGPFSEIMTPWGELLVDIGSQVIATRIAFPPPGSDIATHTVNIPADPGLVGNAISSQAVIVGSSVVLTNAIDFTLGH